MEKTSGQDEIRSMEEQLRRHVNRPRLILLILAVLAVIAGAVYFVLRRNHLCTEARLIGTAEVPAGGSTQFEPFASQMLRYSRDGASLLTAEGRELWNVSWSMNAPKAVTRTNYAAVADMGGTEVTVLDKNGFAGSYSTTDPVVAIALSDTGVTAVALDRGLNTLICFYNKGQRLDIEISLEMSVSGYPLAMALSDDGNGLVVSTVSSTIGALTDQLVFYNFSVGKADSSRLIGYYTYDGHLFPQIDYLNKKRVAAVGDDRIVFFSMEQENKPQELNTVLLSGGIIAYTAGGGYAAAVLPEQKTGEQTLMVWNADGKQCFSAAFSGSCRSLTLDGGRVLLLTDSSLTVWETSGKMIFRGTLPEPGLTFRMPNSRTLVQYDGSHIRRYRLK